MLVPCWHNYVSLKKLRRGWFSLESLLSASGMGIKREPERSRTVGDCLLFAASGEQQDPEKANLFCNCKARSPLYSHSTPYVTAPLLVSGDHGASHGADDSTATATLQGLRQRDLSQSWGIIWASSILLRIHMH